MPHNIRSSVNSSKREAPVVELPNYQSLEADLTRCRAAIKQVLSTFELERWGGEVFTYSDGDSEGWIEFCRKLTYEGNCDDLLDLIDRLRGAGKNKLADRLKRCAGKKRCRSGACPMCGRCLQFKLSKALSFSLTRSVTWAGVSFNVPGNSYVDSGTLDEGWFENARIRVYQELSEAQISFAAGWIGVHYMANGECGGTWGLTGDLIIPAEEVPVLEKAIPNEVWHTAWSGDPALLWHVFEPMGHERRISDDTKSDILCLGPRDGIKEDRLSRREAIEIAPTLAKVGLHGRLILRGLQLDEKYPNSERLLVGVDHGPRFMAT
jgi:hypothetical protein